MIIYDLICEHAHGFEGWFSSAEDYSRQQQSGLLCCPVCASARVRRVPSAVFIGAARDEQATQGQVADTLGGPEHEHSSDNLPDDSRQPNESTSGNKTPPRTEPADGERGAALPLPPSAQRFMLRQLTRSLLAHSEDVGTDFAAEARRIHYAQAPPRSIYGQSSRAEYQELTDEGIGVLCLPVICEDDLN